MKDVGQLAGKDGLFAAIVFGWCPQHRTLRIFELRPVVADGQLLVQSNERLLQQIKLESAVSDSVLAIGSSPSLLTKAIDKELGDARERGDIHDIVARDAPKRALRKLIQDDADEMVGGSIQQAWATPAGFEIVANMEAISPRPPSPRNAGLFILGFDTFELQTVGNYQISSIGL